MTDYTELRRLAERYEDTVDDIDAHLEAVQDYRDATRPPTVLRLLDEVERLRKRRSCCHDPHRGHESDNVYGYPHAPVCLTCSTEDEEVTFFRRQDPCPECDA